jgi:uncharacterized protein DUF5672/SEC-C motif-containing protein
MDSQMPRLAMRALEMSLRQCTFESALLFTDDTTLAAPDSPIEIIAIPRIGSSEQYSRFVLKDLFHHIETDFVQVVQWDGYVTNADGWSDEFLAFDYIGARWWLAEEGRNVGNGGFSLRSRKLLRALQDSDIEARHPEDKVICLEYRDLLENRHGIRVAPSSIADRYSFEGDRRSGKEFGFHRVFNFPYFHDEAELAAVLDSIPAEVFTTAPSVTLVDGLMQLGRRREALRYAKRIRADAQRFAAIPKDFRVHLERLMQILVPRTQPCPCGSAIPYKRCCGDLTKWTA